jgi:uncharacterized protein HemY
MHPLCDQPHTLPETIYLMARMIWLRKKDRAEALHILKRARRTAPHIRRYMQLEVHLLCELEKFDEARAVIQYMRANFGETPDLAQLEEKATI